MSNILFLVTVSSSLDFDGFLMTGLYTSPSGSMSKTMNLLNSNLPTEQGGGKGLVCAVVHSHLSHRPSKSLTFLWLAPPSGTGCVNFLWVIIFKSYYEMKCLLPVIIQCVFLFIIVILWTLKKFQQYMYIWYKFNMFISNVFVVVMFMDVQKE